jgi:alanine dehydrogenase
MPGAVPRTSTFGLTNATLPWALKLAALGAKRAVIEDAALASAANALDGTLTHGAVAEAFRMKWRAAREVAAEL